MTLMDGLGKEAWSNSIAEEGDKEMSVFGKATLKAVELIHANTELDYSEAWRQAIELFTDSESTRSKGCPKNAFVDLCRCGCVKGIEAQADAPASENGRMAIEAIQILSQQHWELSSKEAFWQERFHKSHQGQLDVILALKENALLNDGYNQGGKR